MKKLVADDVQALHYLVTHAVLDLVGAVVTPLATLIYLFAVQWRLGLVLLLPIIAIFLLVTMNSKKVVGEHANGVWANIFGGAVTLIVIGIGSYQLADLLGLLPG